MKYLTLIFWILIRVVLLGGELHLPMTPMEYIRPVYLVLQIPANFEQKEQSKLHEQEKVEDHSLEWTKPITEHGSPLLLMLLLILLVRSLTEFIKAIREE